MPINWILGHKPQQFPMSSINTQKASSLSSSTPQWKYDVFLSFRGENTRNSFTDHLYVSLKQKGIITFRDDKKLEKGKSISPELLKAIETSRFAIVISQKTMQLQHGVWMNLQRSLKA